MSPIVQLKLALPLDPAQLPPELRELVELLKRRIEACDAWRALLDLTAATGPHPLNPMVVVISIPPGSTPGERQRAAHGRDGLTAPLVSLLSATAQQERRAEQDLALLWAVWAIGAILLLPGANRPLWWSVANDTLSVTRADRSAVLVLSLMWPSLSDDDNHNLRAALYELIASPLMAAQPQLAAGEA